MKRVKYTRKKKNIFVIPLILVSLLVGSSLFYKYGLKKEIPSIFQIAAVQNAFSGIQAELGSSSGGVLVKSDASALGGQYIEFNNIPSPTAAPVSSPTTTTPNISFQPTAPYYGTFYYMWYKAPTPDGSYSYWSDHGGSPPNSWFSHYLPDPKPGVFDPASELYSANNYDIFKWQVGKMKEAKIEVAIASWWGPGTKEDTAFNNVIHTFMSRSDNPYPNLRWAMYYEDEGFEDPSVDTIAADLAHIKSKFGSSPYLLRVNSKPVVFVYAGANDTPGTMVERWAQANARTGNSFYYVLKVFPSFASVGNQPSSWHQYAPAKRTDDASPYSYMVSPGFWLDDGSPERLARNPAEFEAGVKSMVASNATWKLIETWNEWGEGTSVEPGIHVHFNSGSGKNEIKSNGYQFGNLYIDILARNLPSLEQGGTTTIASTPTPTPTSNTGTHTVVAVGDIVCGAESGGAACKQMETSSLALSMNPSAVLVLGDIQYEKGSLADFEQYYDPSWGRLKNVTYPVVGNHEYLTSGASGYFDYFNGIGAANGRAGDRTKGYYAYNIGSWRLYALNSNCSQAGGCGVGSPQERWLRADLAANPTKCALAYYHHPIFSSGSRTNPGILPLYQALYDAGVELILAGHEHNYERFAAQNPSGNRDDARGIRDFVVGTGGRNFTQFVTTAKNSEVRTDKAFGVLKLTLKDNSYDAEFVPTAGYSFTDKLSNQLCH